MLATPLGALLKSTLLKYQEMRAPAMQQHSLSKQRNESDYYILLYIIGTTNRFYIFVFLNN